MSDFHSDKRRFSPKFSSHGYLSASDLDRLTAFPDIRIEREGDSVGIFWKFADNVDPESFPVDFSWAIERSGSASGPFELVAVSIAGDVRFWRDDQVPRGRENSRRLYYRLRLESPGNDPIVYGYDPEWNRVHPDSLSYGLTWGGSGVRTEFAPPMIREIRQRVRMLMNYAGGEPVYLFREAWTHLSCSQCVDPLTGTHHSGAGDYCRNCLGTGFEGGYYSPIETVFIPAAQAAQLVQIPTGVTDLKEGTQVILPHWPHVFPRDRFRALDGRIFEAGPVNHPDMYGVPGLQMVVISQIDRDDPMNKIPMPEGFRQRSRGPRRQYARSMNLQSYAQSLAEGSMDRASHFPISDYQQDDR